MLLLFYKMGILVSIIILIGGLFFIYFNLKINFKACITYSYIYISIDIVILKRKINFKRKLFYNILLRKLFKNEKKDAKNTIERYKKYMTYLKYSKYIYKMFIVKNIYIYTEYLDDYNSFVIEFDIVNNILKRSLLSG